MLAWAGELLTYRYLIANLVVRDVKVRYKNSILGFAWSFLNPLLMMLAFTLVFTVLQPSGVPDFPVFFLCGLLPWQFTINAIVTATGSIVGNAHLIKKVYFPRAVLPLSVVLSNLVFFLFTLPLLFAILLIFGIKLTMWVLLLPLIILIQLAFVIGVGLILSTVNVFYRDTEPIVGVLTLVWFFLTPIFYTADTIPQSYTLRGINLNVWQLIHILNPMASLVAAYRAVLYQGAPPAFNFMLYTSIITLVLLTGGIFIFLRYSRFFGEEV
jgi:lipopolysaccharide transport system permease protein